MKKGHRHKLDGFTLVEVIVLIIIVSVVGTLTFAFMGEFFVKSHAPIENLQKSTDLNQVMANIFADYKPYPVWKPNQTYLIGDKVMPTESSLQRQRFWYQCTQNGISYSTEPDPWTTGTIVDNTVRWTYQSTPALLTLNQLYNKIGAEDINNKKLTYDKSTHQYGYYVIKNNWIDFNSSNTEIGSTITNILKVTIRNDNGETLTALFF
jgi:type II secretory pathway pseudopilin PulG